MSEKNHVRSLGVHPRIKNKEHDIPFATDMDFLTNRLWFWLGKGLGDHNSFPLSRDVVAKAQVVLSSQINNSISEKYDSLQEDFSKGKITTDNAGSFNYKLRIEATTPENIDSKLAFLNQGNIETHLREKSLLKARAEEGDILKQELAETEHDRDILKQELAKRDRKNKNKLMFLAKIDRIIMWTVFAILIFLAFCLLIYLANLLRSDSDSILTIISVTLTAVCGILLPLIKVFAIKKVIDKRYKRKMNLNKPANK